MPVYNNTVIAGGGIGGPDVALMSTLLRALRSYSTVTSCQTPGGCHGSPVMVLKDLIDAHFSEAAAAAAVSPLSSHASPFTNFTSRVCIYHLSRFCVRLSVCLSVCPIIRPPHTAAAGLLPWAQWAGDID